MSQSIGVGIIARNSETTLKGCLDSLKDHVDQIVVVLAGESEDKTGEIVRSYGDRVEVYDFEWIDDFSAARNYCFSKLNTDFLLWVDADDVMINPENLRKLVENTDAGAIWLPYNYAQDEFGNVTTLYERERLLRRIYGWLWKGRLHETVSPLSECKFVRSDEAMVKHNHLGGAPRNDRNFRILNIMYKENPEDRRIWLYFGHQHFAGRNWTDSAKWYLKFGSDPTAIPIERYQALCYGSRALRELRDKQCVEVALMAVELFPNFRDGYLELAHSYSLMGDPDKALHWVGISEIKEMITEPPHIIFINPLEYTFNKYCLCAECYMKKGDFERTMYNLQLAHGVRPIKEIEQNMEIIQNLHLRSRVIDSVKVLAVHLLNNNELAKLTYLPKIVPYWLRDLPEYQELVSGVQHHTKDMKDEPQIEEGEGKSAIVNIANVLNPQQYLAELDKKYDKVTVISPITSDGKQSDVLSQYDMERLLAGSEERHILNIRREAQRVWGEYDKKLPTNLHVRMFVGQGLEYWNPATITSIGCGGSETAAAQICKELAARQCQPVMYAMDNQVWDGVIYRLFSDYKPGSIPCHLFISSRVPEVFHENIPAEQKWLWFHDIHRWDKFTPEIAEQIDVLVVLSQWHANFIKATYPFMKDAEVWDYDENKLTYRDCEATDVWYADTQAVNLPKIAIIGNGLDTERYKELTEERVPHRFLWCSSPDRGLEELLNVWPFLKKRLPDAELKIYYGWNYFDNYLAIDSMREFKGRILSLIQQEGIEWCGRVGQEQLALEQMKADATIYPPPHSFRETYGIAFLEAQAAGMLCFYRENGALGETVGNRGIPLKMDMTPEAIADKVADTLLDIKNCDRLRKKARAYAMKRTWGLQADKFLNLYQRVEGLKNGQVGCAEGGGEKSQGFKA